MRCENAQKVGTRKSLWKSKHLNATVLLSAVLVIFKRPVLFEIAMRAGDGDHPDKVSVTPIQIVKEEEFAVAFAACHTDVPLSVLGIIDQS